MNDNEIIKAFEHLVKNANNHISITGKMLLEDVMGVLHRQNAQIEGLQDEVVTKTDMLNEQKAEMEKFERILFYGDAVIKKQEAEIERYLHSIKLLGKDVQTAKAEAIKEFAERLKLTFDDAINAIPRTSGAFSLRGDIIHDALLIIDHVKKVMVGDDNA